MGIKTTKILKLMKYRLAELGYGKFDMLARICLFAACYLGLFYLHYYDQITRETTKFLLLLLVAFGLSWVSLYATRYYASWHMQRGFNVRGDGLWLTHFLEDANASKRHIQLFGAVLYIGTFLFAALFFVYSFNTFINFRSEAMQTAGNKMLVGSLGALFLYLFSTHVRYLWWIKLKKILNFIKEKQSV